MRSRIGECLTQAGLIDARDLARAMREQAKSGERLGAVLVRLRLASEAQIAEALASQLGLAYADFAADAIAPQIAALIPREMAVRETCVAMRLDKQVLTVAMADPLRFSLLQDLQERTGYRIREVVATRTAILDVIEIAYPDAAVDPSAVTLVPPPSGEEDPPGSADELVDRILQDAVGSEASDVHIEPTEADLVVRFRIDGVLREWRRLPAASHEDVVARVKILAGMDVAEKLLPQSGRVRLPSGDDGRVEMRAFTLRTHHGERVVLTTRGRRRSAPSLDDLGMSDHSLAALRTALAESGGMIVIAGPGGSGRSTTLAAALDSVAAGRSAVAIDDGIEYEIAGVNHTQISQMVGLTYASALRSILRQRPDVVLLGDVPDADTAALAAEAARSGKLVLCSLLAADTAAAIVRLRELGVDPSSPSLVRCVVAQRLVRRLCPRCRISHSPGDGDLRAFGAAAVEAMSFFRAAGCSECDYTGYRGRIGVFEVIPFTDALRRSLGAGTDRVRDFAPTEAEATISEDALAKAKRGATSLDEIRRLAHDGRLQRPLCPWCGSVASIEFSACPSCGEPLGGECAHCGRALEPGWTFCPFCAKRAERQVLPPRRGIIRLVRNPDPPDLV